MNTHSAVSFFRPGAVIQRLIPLGQGNINDTWQVDLQDGDSFVLQRLHPSVFPDPTKVMTNIRLVTDFLARRAEAGLSFFRLVTNPEGLDHLVDQHGCCWRLLTRISGTRTLSSLSNPAQAGEIGRLLGRFHCLTAEIESTTLTDPLPDFHITPRYLAQYDKVRGSAPPAGVDEAFCFQLIEELRPSADLLEQARSRLSCQVIHGDPKAANFLFAQEADRAVSLIDFDTVKPGLLLHDLGDCLRSCCNPHGESPARPEAATFDPFLFQALLSGYLQQAGHLLNQADRELLVTSALVISFELGLRFFNDHLAGDHYFKVQQRGQNLHRALVQFHLNHSIRAQQPALERRFEALITGLHSSGPHRR